MTDLGSRLRAHVEALLEDLEDPMSMFDRVVDESSPTVRIEGVEPPRRHRWRPRVVAILAGAAAVVAAVVAVALVAPFDDETAAPSTAGTSTTTGPPTTAHFAVVTGVWTRVPDPNGVFKAQTFVEQVPSGDGSTVRGSSGMFIRSVVDTPEGTVAVGSEQVGLRSIAAVWTSDDGGISWTRAPHDDAVFGGLDHAIGHVGPSGPSMWEVVYADGRFVALGGDTTTSPVPVAWYSDDGHTWVRVPAELGPQPGDGFTSVSGMVAAGLGFVAVGGVSDPDRNAFTAVVWTSDDGETWHTYNDPFASETDPIITDLAVLNGSIIAVGGHWSGGAAAWISEDGLTWELAEVIDETGEPPGEMLDVAVGPNAAVAVGQSPVSAQEPPDSAIWVTTDGRTWQRIASTEVLRERQPGPITWGPAGFVAAATPMSDMFEPGARPQFNDNVLLRSADGRVWEQLPATIAGRVAALIFVDGHYVAAGVAPNQLDPDHPIADGAIWIADLE